MLVAGRVDDAEIASVTARQNVVMLFECGLERDTAVGLMPQSGALRRDGFRVDAAFVAPECLPVARATIGAVSVAVFGENALDRLQPEGLLDFARGLFMVAGGEAVRNG